jgi:hypothetical protein
MPDDPEAQETSSPLPLVHRKRRVRWWIVGAVLTSVPVGIWLLLPWEWSLLLSVTLIAWVLLWRFPHWQVRLEWGLDAKEKFDRVNEARKTLTTIIGGTVLLWGGFFTWQNLKTSKEALNVSREGQSYDRFDKAIQRLGAVDASGEKGLEVRLSGIYVLADIANESEKLHWPIMKEFCAYVREHAPLKPQESSQEKQAPARLGIDIQEILTVLGSRVHKDEGTNQILDLRGTELSGAELPGAYLSKADLHGADLGGAVLSGAILNEAILKEANLSGAILNGAHLNCAHLDRANLLGAVLGGAKLVKADLSAADLSGGANLRLADLRGAILRRANLGGVDLGGAIVDGADLRADNLTQQQIDAAKGDPNTLLPDNRHRPETWKKEAAWYDCERE